MNHLEEGTIHAWLDGALDDAQAREVESHVASCAECRERVAEVRGLIAGASRILGALDDVPGGVLPAGTRAAPAQPAVTPARPQQRRWASKPWIAGIAAVLVAAVVLRTSDMVSRDESAAEMSARAAMDTVQSIIEAPSPVANAPTPAPVAAQSDASSERRALAETEATRSRERRLAQEGASTANLGAAAGAGAPAPRPREERVGFAARDARTEQAPPAALPPAPPMPAPQITGEMAMKAAAEAVTVTSAPTLENALSGCYVVSLGVERTDATFLADESRSRAASRVARPQMGAAAPAAAAPSVAARGELPGARLVSLSLVPSDSARTFVVRDARVDSAVGTWRVVDSTAAEIRFTGGQRVVVPRTIRTPCP